MSIAVHQLGRRFGPVRALDGIEFELAPGEIVGLIGPNGAGKTTLLRILATLCAADEGRAIVGGFDCARQSEEVRRRIGFVPENPPVIPEARVDEYLTYRAALHDLPRPARMRAVERVLEQCQLRDVRRRLARQLSHGYRRRLSLAEALLNDPSVLLLDEPTIGLDPLQIRQTHDLLSSLAAERTILISTHLLADAETLCQRALILLRGKLADDVRIDALSTFGFEAEVLGPLDAVQRWMAAELTTGSYTVLPDGWCRVSVRDAGIDRREEVAARCLNSGWKLRELRRTTATLEERLVRLTMQMRS